MVFDHGQKLRCGEENREGHIIVWKVVEVGGYRRLWSALLHHLNLIYPSLLIRW